MSASGRRFVALIDWYVVLAGPPTQPKLFDQVHVQQTMTHKGLLSLTRYDRCPFHVNGMFYYIGRRRNNKHDIENLRDFTGRYYRQIRRGFAGMANFPAPTEWMALKPPTLQQILHQRLVEADACVGRQVVDELHAYVFDVAPKKIEKNERYFQGRVWVDEKDLQIVKSFGKAVPDIMKKNNENIFPHFETYRENITGPYWFPTYTHADDTLHFTSGGIRIRMTVKYANYKRFGSSHKIGTPVEVKE